MLISVLFFFPCSVYSRKPILVFSCRQTPPEENSTNSKNTTWLLTTTLQHNQNMFMFKLKARENEDVMEIYILDHSPLV